MANTNIGIIVSVVDKASGKLRSVEAALDRFNKKIEESAKASRRVAMGFAAVGAAVGTLGYKMISAAADMEQTQIAFETMLGSAEAAQKFVKDLTQFAAKTPFELKGLEDASKKLLAFGIDVKNVLPDLKALGDISAGVGTEKLPFLINAFGQVRAKGRLMGQELLQFTEAGVPLLEELAKTLGKTNAEVQDMISKGQVSFETVRKALYGLTQEGGRFNNLMDKQSKSLNGMISNLADAWDIFLRGEGQALLEWAKKFVGWAIYVVQDVLPAFIQQIKAVTDWLNKHRLVLAIAVGVIAGMLTPAVIALTTKMAALAVATLAALWPYMLIGGAIAALIYGIYKLIENWDTLSEKTLAIWDKISSYVSEKITKLKTFIVNVWEATTTFLYEALANTLGFITGLVISFFDTFLPGWRQYLEVIKQAWQIAFDFLLQITKKVFGAIVAFIQTFYTKINVKLSAIKNIFVSVWQGIYDFMRTTWQKITSYINEKIKWITDKVNYLLNLIQKVKNAASYIGSKVGGWVSNTTQIGRSALGLAKGGIVTRATPAIIGEGAESEAVLPLSHLRALLGGGGSGQQIVITGNTFYGAEDAAEELAEMLADKLGLQYRGI